MNSQKKPKVFQVGSPKSGNTLLSRIIRSSFKVQGFEIESFIKKHEEYETIKDWDLSHENQNEIDFIETKNDSINFRISSRYEEKIEDVDEYMSKTDHVWTHSNLNPKIQNIIDNYFTSAFYIVRDPRDSTLSQGDFMLTDYMKENYPNNIDSRDEFVSKAIELRTEKWVESVKSYLDGNSINFVFYENIVKNRKESIKSIMKEIFNNYKGFEKVFEETKYENMKEGSKDHLNDSKMIRWKDQLSDKHNEKVKEIAGDLLLKFGYPLNRDEPLKKLDLMK